MKTRLFGYCLESSEIEWTLLTSCRQYRTWLSTRFCTAEERPARSARLRDIEDFESFYGQAIDLARSMGSKGDFLVEPHVGFLPSSHLLSAYIVWKDDDHGSTFIVSSVEMTWLNGVALNQIAA